MLFSIFYSVLIRLFVSITTKVYANSNHFIYPLNKILDSTTGRRWHFPQPLGRGTRPMNTWGLKFELGWAASQLKAICRFDNLHY